MSVQTAHNLEEKQRTEDIKISENVDFAAMLLSDNILQGLQKCGFKKPSPIQLKAIPLGRCGFDLIIKAKSGTGKTAVFGITTLEMINLEKNSVQVLILAPTREIAVQIQQVITSIGCELKGLRVEYFIGGTPVKDDEIKSQNCHIAVGAPGRIKHLIDKKSLDVSEIRLFVLDEADKLMQGSYQADVNWIFHKLPIRKQVIAASATYPDELDIFLSNYMTSPTHVSPDANVPVLLGLKQFYTTVKSHLNVLQQMKFKTAELTRILSNISFNQCLLFSNYQTRAESLSNNLVQQGWPSIFISGHQDQTTRLKVFESLKQFKCRILSSTDLTARGIDAANVDLVINYDVPYDTETYLHRMGRAGRYGSYGICITIAAEGKDVENLQKILHDMGKNISLCKLPEDDKFLKDIWQSDVKHLEQLSGVSNNLTENTNLTEINQNSEDKQLNVSIEKDKLQEKEIKSNEIYNFETIKQIQNTKETDEIFEKAILQLTDLLTKPYITSTDNNDINNVKYVLQNIKNKNELSKVDLIENYKHMDNQTIINNISSGTIKFNIFNKQEPEINIEHKKKKLDELELVELKMDTSNYENEAKSYQENIILKKNLALYTITKYLIEQKETINEECLKSIDNLLEIIKAQDIFEKEKYNEDSIRKFLEKNNILTKKYERNVDIVDEETFDKFCNCKENLFSMAFDYSVLTDDSENWINGICDEHKIEEKVTKESNEDENMGNDETFGEYIENEEIYNEYMENEEIVDDDCLLNEEIYNKEDENAENNIEYDENLFSIAYDNAIQGKTKENYETLYDTQDTNSQSFGYATDTSYAKKFVNFAPHSPDDKINKKMANQKRKLVNNEPYVSLDLQNFVARRNSYASYYQHYSDVLAESAPRFRNIQEFHKWFGKWKDEVEAVRDFVQQDVYVKECKKNKCYE